MAHEGDSGIEDEPGQLVVLTHRLAMPVIVARVDEALDIRPPAPQDT